MSRRDVVWGAALALGLGGLALSFPVPEAGIANVQGSIQLTLPRGWQAR